MKKDRRLIVQMHFERLLIANYRKSTNDLTVQFDQLTDEKKKNNEKDLEEMDKMVNDLNADVDMAHKQLDTANDDKDGNEAIKQKYQDKLKSVRTELYQVNKDHTKTQLIKGKYEKDIAEIIRFICSANTI
ncbi:hypothetical protein EIN_502430 [Entamoeba invadens IP1]|uniref:Uncharacterized protein n=1 Tax=Entamoeba invadens IP1 TaxID=370355 RepID=A0A0A1TUZ7_ENTIV|nr:hypothetical protein EIN_502430 [Entamoeba invadens IP1]ELP84110.1 hypothetical protein EIN_502430 [Entamoeba invadens IP1]|eukprot:XP_004183456.1 hypothetical protein EIN_502430 [Entamoeba invadens IP1]